MQGRKIHPRPTLRAREPKEKEGFVLRKNQETKMPATPAAAVRARRKIDFKQMMIHEVACGCDDGQIRFAINIAEEMPVITSSQVSAGSA